MKIFGTPYTSSAVRVMLLGSGELGKELAIELQRFAVEVIAVDRYAHAPAMQVAQRSHVVNMLDAAALRSVIAAERPDIVVPEIEAIATALLVELERDGLCVIPTARATALTMDREGIRQLAAEELGLPTSPYAFVDSREEYREAVTRLGLPVVVKPLMSSSGKGQSNVRNEHDIDAAWDIAQAQGRAGRGRCIVEGLVEFDYEITLLTVRHAGGTDFCAPIGHLQRDGDYRESWQPQPMAEAVLANARDQARIITDALGGRGVFGVEFFVRGDEVIFSEVSPRPHDTGLVTLISQELSEFALHARAILGLPIPSIQQLGPSASCAVLAEGHGSVRFHGVAQALAEPDTALRLFGKPEVAGRRRMAVTLARGADIDEARCKARESAAQLTVEVVSANPDSANPDSE